MPDHLIVVVSVISDIVV